MVLKLNLKECTEPCFQYFSHFLVRSVHANTDYLSVSEMKPYYIAWMFLYHIEPFDIEVGQFSVWLLYAARLFLLLVEPLNVLRQANAPFGSCSPILWPIFHMSQLCNSMSLGIFLISNFNPHIACEIWEIMPAVCGGMPLVERYKYSYLHIIVPREVATFCTQIFSCFALLLFL